MLVGRSKHVPLCKKVLPSVHCGKTLANPVLSYSSSHHSNWNQGATKNILDAKFIISHTRPTTRTVQTNQIRPWQKL